MGACCSRSEEHDSSYPGNDPNASSLVINGPPEPHSATQPPSPDVSPAAHHPRRRRDPRPLDQHINKPLRLHRWTSKRCRWTRRQLTAERQEFFDTRVTGRPEIWQTIHAALEVLWDASSDESQNGNGNELATAQSILDAAEISIPTGDLVNGVYDSLGNLYQLPEEVVSDPTNIFDDGPMDDKGDIAAGAEDQSELDDGDGDDSERRREEKGKAVIDVREQVSVRARLSENGRDYQVSVAKSDSVRSVTRKIAEESGLDLSKKKIRLGHLGRILKDGSSLEAQGWELGHVVNAFVFDRQDG